MNKDIKKLEEASKKLSTLSKEIEQNPLLLVCPAHHATKEEVTKIREKHSWRGVARTTSKGTCTNQICGWFLCINAGIDQGPE